MFEFLFGSMNLGNISPKEAKAKLENDKKVILLDVRTPEEYRSAKIPGSKLLPVDRIGEIGKITSDKQTEIIVYCQSGARSCRAAAQLKRMGYDNVRNLGGIINWPYDIVAGR